MSAEENGGRPVSLAAMSVCEAIIIGLVENGVLDWEELSETLESAIDAHRHAAADDFSHAEHARAADIIRALLRKMNALQPGGVSH